jgi:hypothetical protein
MPETGRFCVESKNNSLLGTTVWRRTQSPANPSLRQIPVNREKYREFCSSERLNRVHPLVNTGVSGFRPEIVTGNEQGNNRRDNRENVWRNRNLSLQLLPTARSWIQSCFLRSPLRFTADRIELEGYGNLLFRQGWSCPGKCGLQERRTTALSKANGPWTCLHTPSLFFSLNFSRSHSTKSFIALARLNLVSSANWLNFV